MLSQVLRNTVSYEALVTSLLKESKDIRTENKEKNVVFKR